MSHPKPIINICWLRRDLRLEDNTALYHALSERKNVQLLFIFDTEIVDDLSSHDKRLLFIYKSLEKLHHTLRASGAGVLIKRGVPLKVFKELMKDNHIESIYCNHDYEPYSRQRDEEVSRYAHEQGCHFKTFKDHVIFEKNEVLKPDATPYTVFTPYSKKWLQIYSETSMPTYDSRPFWGHFYKNSTLSFPAPEELGLKSAAFTFPPLKLEASLIAAYEDTRDFPSLEGTSRLGIHLRFGTLSIRKAVSFAAKHSRIWLKELIWREFFMMILWHFPYVETGAFRKHYDNMEWLNDEELFDKWCRGQTGYPIVDAGMRELVATGYMHNRVRMVTASFLAKHLLHDWRQGEAFFAKHLLDYEAASNNGNWQWAASTGCDAAPYFRVFNPLLQQQKYDKDRLYIKKWLPEIDSAAYPDPIVVHEKARQRALVAYKQCSPK